MSKDELINLITEICSLKTEKQNVEVKSSHTGCPKRLYDTLSSFSNQDCGGVLVFGIDEASGFAPVGVYDLNDLQKKVAEQCNQMVPPVRAVFTTAEFQGANICAVEIPPLDVSERPCFYGGAGRFKGSYVRVGDADVPMTEYEIYALEAFRRRMHDDIRICENAETGMLESEKLDAFLSRMKRDKPGFARLAKEQMMEMLAITRKGVPTLSAIMNFALYPQGYYPQLAITAIVVPGTEIGDVTESGSRFVDNKRIEGVLPEMLEGALSFCRRNMRCGTCINKDSGLRNDVFEYPLPALREALLNALIHRDYSIYTEGTPIQVCMFTDRMEIHSPGCLYGRMTVEDLGHARPDLRNPALAAMSEFLLNTENRYSGIPTMRKEMAHAGLPEPLFESRRNEFVVTFFNSPKPQKEVNLEGSPDNLLEFCRKPRTRDEIAQFLKIDTVSYAMRKYVQPLLLEKKLAMSIPEQPRSRKQTYFTV